MINIKDVYLERIEAKARGEAEQLAGEFARAAADEKESLLAALEFEQWLAESCRQCRTCRP